MNLNEFFVDIADIVENGGLVGDLSPGVLIRKKTQERHNVLLKKQKFSDGKPLDHTTPLFENEIHFYKNIWTKLRQFYEDKTGQTLDMVPECFGTLDGELKEILLENLATDGYVILDKMKCYDDKDICKIFKTIGIFHGISMAFKQNNCEEYEHFLKPIHYMYRENFKNERIISRGAQYFSGYIQKYFDPKTEGAVINKLRLYENRGANIIYKCFVEDVSRAVLLHGDFSSNNIMLKYDENGKLQKIKFIDFQVVSSGSPVFDLAHCLYTGGSEETFEKLDYYLEIYHNSLSHTLKVFDIDAKQMYPFERLQNDWKSYGKYGFAWGPILWRIKLSDDYIVEYFTEITAKNAAKIEIPDISENKEKVYKQRIRELVLHMYKKAYS